MTRRAPRFIGLALVLAFAGAAARSAQPGLSLSAPVHLAAGIDYFTSTDRRLTNPTGPIAVYLLRLDPARARLSSVHANDEIMGVETVDRLAQRHHAIAGVNGGFFNGVNGDPQFVLKEAGELESDTGAIKGAVVIQSPPRGRTALDFDQVSAKVTLTFDAEGRRVTVPVGGINTTRARGKLMLYTARYHADTDTAPNGTEWILDGTPPRVSGIRRGAGRTPIPAGGSVLSFGGVDLPPELLALTPGTSVAFQIAWTAIDGLSAARLNSAADIVTGAGLLRVKGRVPSNWQTVEALPQAFLESRHPRTLIGVDARGFIWLAAIDGRQPDHSVGMTFAELETLCDRLQLTDALNLDGGGSTTMVVKDAIVNRPFDLIPGARPVSDAILVTAR